MTLFTWLTLCLLAVGLVYQAVATRRLARFSGRPPATPPTLPPVTILRPIKPGVRDLEGKLRALADSIRPGDEILAGFDPDELPPFEIPGVTMLPCPLHQVPNRKVAKLQFLAEHAQHPRWIVMDSESIVNRDFLDHFRTEWMEVHVLTAGYRFTGATCLAEAADHAPVLLGLWPGLMFARLNFTLGACTGVERDAVESIGGWQALGEYLAEDFQLGNQLTARGATIGLSRAILSLDSDPLDWGDWWRHQVRVAVTYRISAPEGWAGAVVTLTAFWAIILVIQAPEEGWRWASAMAAIWTRLRFARVNEKSLQAPPLPAPAILAAIVAEPVFWAVSWMSSRVWWGGRRLGITPSGKIRTPSPQGPGQSREDDGPR